MIRKQWLLVLALLAVLALALAACGGQQEATEAPATEAPKAEMTEEAMPEKTEEPTEEATEAAATEEPTEEAAEPALGTAENPIIWVLTPSQDTEKVLAGAEPIAQYIEEQTGIVIKPVIPTDYTAQQEAMC